MDLGGEPEGEIASAVDLADLVVIENGQPMTTNLKVAEVFGKEHKHVLRDIQNLGCSDAFRESNFGLTQIEVQAGAVKRMSPMYHITRDAFTFLAMGFTGARAAEFKEQYIATFNTMEQELRGRMTTAVQPMSSMEMLELQLSAMKEVNQKAELAKREAVQAQQEAERAQKEARAETEARRLSNRMPSMVENLMFLGSE